MEDEFKRPYEYDENPEKRGFMIFFILMILVIDTFLSAAYMVQVNNIFKDVIFLKISFLALSGLFVVFLLFTVIACIRLSKHFVAISKLYLKIRIVYMCIAMLILFFTILSGHDIAGSNYGYIKSTGKILLTFLIIPLLYNLSFYFAWNVYFKKSKRCMELVEARKAGLPL